MKQLSYRNKMHSPRTVALLEEAARLGQRVLDVGGGVGPWHQSAHILDILPFDRERMQTTMWGGDRPGGWQPEQYTQQDICDGKWPFADGAFDVGYSAGVLEDLRDPIFVAREMQRVCRRVILEGPSRLCEQTAGIDHQRWSGFWHHRWMMYEQDSSLIFQRKTYLINLPGCHHQLRPWERAAGDELLFVFAAPSPFPVREVAFWNERDEAANLRKYVATNPLHREREANWRKIVFNLRQKYLAQIE
jgi:SAM-dependent methyltransferase